MLVNSLKKDINLDNENPEWTEEMFAKAISAREFFTAEEFEELTKKLGRPKSAEVKDFLNIRLDKSVTDHLRASGKGWQTRLNAFIAKGIAQGEL